MSFIFDKLAPPLNKRFKIGIKSFFESIPRQKTVVEGLKRGIFLILRFAQQANLGAIVPPPPFGCDTDHSTIQAMNLVCLV